jgi:hypothetical protein
MELSGASFWVEACTEEKLSIQELLNALDQHQIEHSLHQNWPAIVKVYDRLPESATTEVLVTKLTRTTFAMTRTACFILPSLHRLLKAFGAKVIKMSELQHAKGDTFVIRSAQEPLISYNLILKYKQKMVLTLWEAVSSILGPMVKIRADLENGLASTSEMATMSKQILAEIRMKAPYQPADASTVKRGRRLTTASLSPWNPGEKSKEPHDERNDAAILVQRVKDASTVMQNMVVHIAEVEEDDTEDV